VPRYSHSAVDRNRVKRRLREIVRIEVLAALPNVDVVVRALPSAYSAGVSELREQCVRACSRIQGAA
jgi:ribonuclease P protein component